LVSFPHSATIITTRQTRFQSRRSPLIGFHNLPAGYKRCQQLADLFHSAGTPRVWPSKVYIDAIASVVRRAYSFAVTRFTWFPSLFQSTLPRALPWRIIRTHDIIKTRPLVFLRKPASILSLSQPWSFNPASMRHPLLVSFTQKAR